MRMGLAHTSEGETAVFRQIIVAACAIAAIGITVASPACAAGNLSRYSVQGSVQKADASRFVIVARPSLGDKVTLNPQPLPPKVGALRGGR